VTRSTPEDTGRASLAAIVLDVDGTLLDELGSTGPVVAFSGALVCEPEEDAGPTVLFERRLRRASAAQIVANASRLELEIGWHAGERWYAPTVGAGLRREATITRQRVEPLPDLDGCDEPHKLLCIAHHAGGLPALRAFGEQIPADCHAQYSHHNYLEITARGVDKAAAIRRVCEHMTISPFAIAAIGDGENDIELLRLAGIGVAMGHAGSAVRAAADWVTASNDQDGVALAIDRLLAERRGNRTCEGSPRIAAMTANR